MQLLSIGSADPLSDLTSAATAGKWGLVAGISLVLCVSVIKRKGWIAAVGRKWLRTLLTSLCAFGMGMGLALQAGADWTVAAWAGVVALVGPIGYKGLPPGAKTVLDGRSR